MALDKKGRCAPVAASRALNERFANEGPLSARELAEMEAGRCAAILGQTGAPEPVAELMDRAFDELGLTSVEVDVR